MSNSLRSLIPAKVARAELASEARTVERVSMKLLKETREFRWAFNRLQERLEMLAVCVYDGNASAIARARVELNRATVDVQRLVVELTAGAGELDECVGGLALIDMDVQDERECSEVTGSEELQTTPANV